MNRIGFGIQTLVIGFYAWISAVFLGGILLDVLYSKLLADVLEDPERSAVFSNVSDFLLLIGVLMAITGAAAVVVCWRSRLTGYFLLASLVIVLFEFLAPVFFPPLIQELYGLKILSLIRILPVGLASILAFIGLISYSLQNG